VREAGKRARYAANFLRRKLVHTNLQILYECNFKCAICDFWRHPDKRYAAVTAEQVQCMSLKLAKIGPQIVSIGGGEPLLHPELQEIVRILAKDHFPVMICNGWFITKENARALFDAGLHEISISVDYADAAMHDSVRGVKGAFDQALSALETCMSNRTSAHQRVHMISVVMDDNLDHIERLIRICRELGVTYLVTLYSDHRGNKSRRVPQQEVSLRLLLLKNEYEEFVTLNGYIGRFSEAIEQRGIGPCRAGRNLCNVDSNGNVSLCIDRMDEPVANLLADDVDIVERKLIEAYRQNDCTGCWTSCRGAIETLMYGKSFVRNFRDYLAMTREIHL
jgi:MoaA/NifB/PqqE/SkfB family radical SAM enzyme